MSPLSTLSTDKPPLITIGRSVFAHRYGGRTATARQTDIWLVVHTAARLAEGIEGEQATLVGVLDCAHQRPRGEGPRDAPPAGYRRRGPGPAATRAPAAALIRLDPLLP